MKEICQNPILEAIGFILVFAIRALYITAIILLALINISLRL